MVPLADLGIVFFRYKPRCPLLGQKAIRVSKPERTQDYLTTKRKLLKFLARLVDCKRRLAPLLNYTRLKRYLDYRMMASVMCQL